MTDLHVADAKPDDAADLVDVIHTAFGARPPLDPPGTAMHESIGSVASALEEHGGLIAHVDGHPAGAIVFERAQPWLALRRVSVHPRFQHRGVATAMVGCAEEAAENLGLEGVRLVARAELPATLEFWRRRGYHEISRDGVNVHVAKRLPIDISVPTPSDMHELGVRLARLLRAGDLVLLTGELGAGKTTLTRGLGSGLGVRGEVTSPTFVISRVHRIETDGFSGGSRGAEPPAGSLVHVDAYRLGGVAELFDLDLETSLDEAVTVVEWGEGLAEGLADDRLEVVISRTTGSSRAIGTMEPADLAAGPVPEASEGVEDLDPRDIRVLPVGRRWMDVSLRSVLDGSPSSALDG